MNSANDAPVLSPAALSFDGVNDIATTAANMTLNGGHAVEAMIKTTAAGTSFAGIVSSNSAFAGGFFQMVMNSGKLVVQVSDNNGQGFYATSTVDINDGNWHKVGFSYDHSAKSATV